MKFAWNVRGAGRIGLLALLLSIAPLASAQVSEGADACATCTDVLRVWTLMQEVISAPDPARTAHMLKLVGARFGAVCRDDITIGETVCDMASAEPGTRIGLTLALADDRRMAERPHFLWVKLRYPAPRPERMRELASSFPTWRLGQAQLCAQDIWRRGPVAHTFTRVEIQGNWRDASGCEDRVQALELLTTTGDFPAPRIH